MSPDRTPGQRAGLTRSLVIAAARELADEQGVEAVSMRAIAQRLEVSPNALYSHVASRTELLDGLLDEVLDEVHAPDPTVEDPVEGLHALMRSTYVVLLSHPDLVPLYLARQGAHGPNAQHLGDVMLALLARAGITGASGREALRVLIVYTIGFAAFTAGGAAAFDGDSTPRAAELAANFESGLSWLLAGVGL